MRTVRRQISRACKLQRPSSCPPPSLRPRSLAPLSGSLARWALPISFTLLFLVISFPFVAVPSSLRFSGAFFCVLGFYLLRFSSAFLLSLLVFPSFMLLWEYFFPPSYFYTSLLSISFPPLTFSSFALHFGIFFFLPFSLSIF